MKVRTLLILLFIVNVFIASAQDEKTIDILINSNDENIEYSLKEYIPAFVEKHNAEENCATYNIIQSLDEAKNPIIIELWESKEYLSTNIFREKRKKTKKVQGKEDQTVNYIAAGIKVHTELEVYARMIEKESTAVLDLFKLDADVDREIESSDVKTKWRKGNNSALRENVLANFDSKIAQRREDIRLEIQDAVFKGIKEMVGRVLLPQATIDKAVKIKKDKAKQVSIQKCEDQEIFEGSSLFYYPVYLKDTMAGFDIYREVGSAYPRGKEKDSAYGVRDGEKEILTYLNEKKQIHMGSVPSMYHYSQSKDKVDKTLDIDFIFQFESTHNYTPIDILNFEFMYQSYFLGYRDVRVIAYNPITQSINQTFSKSIFDTEVDTSKIQAEVDMNKSAKSLWVKISNPTKNKLSKDSGVRLFSDKKVTAVQEDKVIRINTSFKKDGKEYKDEQFIGVKNRRIGLDIVHNSLDLDDMHFAILNPNAKIIRSVFSKKGKLESFLLESMSPVRNKQKYKVYDKENVVKKTKKLGELKVIEVLNKYLVIAEIDSGKSKITKSLDSGKTLYTKRASSGLMGIMGGEYTGSLKVAYLKSEKL